METKDLDELKQDIKTIKDLLQPAEKKLPISAWFFYGIGLLVATATFGWYFIPALRGLDFDFLLLVYWLPAFVVGLGLGTMAIWSHHRQAKSVVVVGALKDALVARFIFVPVIWFMVYLLRTDPHFPAIVLLGVAGMQGMALFIFPKAIRFIPFSVLLVAFTEYFAGLGGAEIGLLNGVLIGLSLSGLGFIYNREAQRLG